MSLHFTAPRSRRSARGVTSTHERIVATVAALLCASLPAAASAHHSFAAVFEMDTVTEIEGRVTDVQWVNPHIKIHVAASDGQSWEIEAGPVNLLSRMGIEKSMIEVGATIRVRGNPGRRNARALWVSNILLPNGTELLAAPGAQAHFGLEDGRRRDGLLRRGRSQVAGRKRALVLPDLVTADLRISAAARHARPHRRRPARTGALRKRRASRRRLRGAGHAVRDDEPVSDRDRRSAATAGC